MKYLRSLVVLAMAIIFLVGGMVNESLAATPVPVTGYYSLFKGTNIEDNILESKNTTPQNVHYFLKGRYADGSVEYCGYGYPNGVGVTTAMAFAKDGDIPVIVGADIVIDGGVSGIVDDYAVWTFNVGDGTTGLWFDVENDLVLPMVSMSVAEGIFGSSVAVLGYDASRDWWYTDIGSIEVVSEPVVITSPVDGAFDVDPNSATVTVVNNVGGVGTISVVVMDALGENELLVVTESIGDDFDISPAMKYGEGRIIYAELTLDGKVVAIAGPISITGDGCIDNDDCTDYVFCNGDEVCNAGGQCEAGVEPCNSDQVCDNDTSQCLAQMCFDGSECAFGSICQAPAGEVEEVCVTDDPVSPWESLFIGEGGWWPFPKYASQADRFVFTKQWRIAAAFDEDYTTCQGIPDAILKYRPVGSQVWKSVVATESYPGAEEFVVGFYLPVEDMPDDAYELRVGYTDCVRNMSESRSFYFTLDMHE